MARKKTKQITDKKIEDRISRRETEIHDTLNEIIGTVEKYFAVSAFQWINENSAEPGSYSFPEKQIIPGGRFDTNFDDWMKKLFPQSQEREELPYAAQKLGFMCGVLVGAKAHGANVNDLENLSRGFEPQLDFEKKLLKMRDQKA